MSNNGVSSTPNTNGTGVTNGANNSNVMSAANGDLVDTSNGNVIADNSSNNNATNSNNASSPNAPAPNAPAPETSDTSRAVSGVILTISIIFLIVVLVSFVVSTNNRETPPSPWSPFGYIFGGLVAIAGIVVSQVVIPKNL